MQSVHKLGISKAFRYENYGYIFLIEKKNSNEVDETIVGNGYRKAGDHKTK